MKKNILIALALTTIFIASIAIVIFYQQQKIAQIPKNVPIADFPGASPTPTPNYPVHDWQNVTDENFRLSIDYPKDIFPYSGQPLISKDQFQFSAFSTSSMSDHRALTGNDLQLEVVAIKNAKSLLSLIDAVNKAPYDGVIKTSFPDNFGILIKGKNVFRDTESGVSITYFSEPKKEYSTYVLIHRFGDNAVVIRVLSGSPNHELARYLITSIDSSLQFYPPNISDGVDTSTWKTYKNGKYGFEFKYPERWFSNSSDLYMSMSESDQFNSSYFSVEVSPFISMDKAKDTAIHFFAFSTAGLGDQDPEITFQKDSSFMSYPAYELVYHLKKPYDQKIPDIYQFLINYHTSLIDIRMNISEKSIRDQILSTFKFTQ